jgi:ATP-dependent protease ClpP protease subunit
MTGQPLDVIEKDTDCDKWLAAQAARKSGLIDEFLYKRQEVTFEQKPH